MPDKYEDLLDFLAKDEEEAIKGYDDVIEKLGDSPVVAQLKKIRDEEQAHLDFLLKAKDDENAKYVDPSDNNDEEKDAELKAASKIFKINLKGE